MFINVYYVCVEQSNKKLDADQPSSRIETRNDSINKDGTN